MVVDAPPPPPPPRTPCPLIAVWYAVLPAPVAPQPPPQHPRAESEPHARAWLAIRELVLAWRWRRRVQVVFETP